MMSKKDTRFSWCAILIETVRIFTASTGILVFFWGVLLEKSDKWFFINFGGVCLLVMIFSSLSPIVRREVYELG